MNQAKFTRGPVTYDGMGCLMGGKPKKLLAQEIGSPHDADLIVAAFNSATACADMGYDGIKALEALPKILKAILSIQHNAQVMNQAEPNRVWTAIDDGCRTILAQAGQKQLSPQ